MRYKFLFILLLLLPSSVSGNSFNTGIELASNAFLYNELCAKFTPDQVQNMRKALSVLRIDLDRPTHMMLINAAIAEKKPAWKLNLKRACSIYKELFDSI